MKRIMFSESIISPTRNLEGKKSWNKNLQIYTKIHDIKAHGDLYAWQQKMA